MRSIGITLGVVVGIIAGLGAVVAVLEARSKSPKAVAPPDDPAVMIAFDDDVTAMAVSPDGRLLATALSSADAVRLWDVTTGAPVGPPLASRGWRVSQLAFNPDGTRLATAAQSGAVVWDTASGTRVHDLFLNDVPSGGSGTTAVAFSPDGRLLAGAELDSAAFGEVPGGTVSIPHRVLFWDAATGAPAGGPLVGLQPLSDLAFSPDGRTLVSNDWDGLRLWDVASRRPKGETLAGAVDTAGLVMDLELSSDGNVLAWGTAAGGLYAWHDPTGAQPDKRVMDHEAPAQSVALSPDGDLLAAAVASGVQMWDTGSGEPVAEDAMASFSRVTAISDVAFTPDGKSLVIAGDDGVRIWPTPAATEPS